MTGIKGLLSHCIHYPSLREVLPENCCILAIGIAVFREPNMPPKTIAVLGGLDYDLIMIANRIPDQGESLLANEYLEAPGEKGAYYANATGHDHCPAYKVKVLDTTGAG
jgi:hypothetical protein